MSTHTASSPPTIRPGRPLQSQDIPWPARARVLGIWGVLLALMGLILVAQLPLSGQVTVQVGDVAPQDVTAPRQITYISEILTQQRKAMAANSVPELYDPPQARVGREQFALASQILAYINAVRSDSYADAPTKTTYIEAISALDLPAPVIERILTLPDPAWERVAAEIQVVLERAMREEIRENNLADERRKVPARVRLDLSDDDVTLITEVVQDLLIPNSFYNPERTEERRAAASAAVEAVSTTLERNQTILRTGAIVTDLDLEALKALGLQQSRWSWEDVLAAAGFVLLLGIVLLYYLWRQEPQLWFGRAEILLLAGVIVVFLLVAKIMIPGRAVVAYLFPFAAIGMILSITLNQRVGLVITGLFALIVGWLTNGSVELIAYALCGSLVGMLKIRRADRLANFSWSTLFITATNLLVVLAFRVAGSNWDLRGLAELGIAAIINGLITVTVTLLALYLISAVFGITTSLQLLEISRPTHPLLRQLMLKAPGTYHHTLIVSNMAERAAEAIGADALLTRVGAYYHDVGKTIRPYFFVENRTENLDPHARLDPLTSAQVIITHVKDGIDLAHKYRLPNRVIDFIPEHQGTLLVSYFYHQAVQQAGSSEAVDKALYRYPGPRPRSKETAITMLADGAEATVRAKHPASVEELDQIVGESIQNRYLSGQLDECPLTMADLGVVRKAFVDVLRGLQHPRIAYPTDAVMAQAAPLADADAPRPAAPAAPPAPLAPARPADKLDAVPDTGASNNGSPLAF